MAEAGLRRSHVALMPEGEPGSIDVLAPLHPGVMAWGIDALDYLQRPAELTARFDAYRAIGVDLLACNVWMLTATPRVLHDNPRYQDAVCRDIEGTPIVPRWLDGEYQGVPSYWGCTNHPLFREQLRARARAGIAAGANLLHLDDHLGTAAAAEHSGGCFCDACMAGFAAWLAVPRTREEMSQVQQRGLGPAVDYRQFLREEGITTRADYDAAVRAGSLPLREEFLRFQREMAADFVRELSAVAATTAGHPVPVGVNAWNLAPTQLATAHVADYFANEVSHYGVEDLTPPRTYLLADALGKPVFSTGTGEDWIEVRKHGDVARVQRWIALAHAFGHHFMYAYNKWGFSEETGTQWYQTPVDTYAPICAFITAHPELFDGFEPAPQVGVLYDNAGARRGDVQVEPILRELHDAHYSVGLAVAGDAWLRHTLTREELERFAIVVVPEHVSLDRDQADVLNTFHAANRVVEWKGVAGLRKRIQPWVSVAGPARAWALPRINRSGVSPRVAVHVLNLGPVVDGAIVPAEGALQLTVDERLLSGNVATRAVWFAPGGEARLLSVERREGQSRIEVPGLAIWGVLLLE
jgi:hypothetical protein